MFAGRSLAPAKTVATIRARGTFNKSGGVTPLKSCLKNSSTRDPIQQNMTNLV